MFRLPDPAPTSVPLPADEHPDAPSVVKPDALLREARRQRDLPPGGDLARRLHRDGRSRPCPAGERCRAELDRFHLRGRAGRGTARRRVCIVGRGVGVPFAVLVAGHVP